MAQNSLSLVWFRQDLRLADNPALTAAANNGRVLPIYILDDTAAGDAAMGAASRVWLHHSLADLNRSLGGALRFFRGDAKKIIERLTKTLPLEGVYWNRCYEPWRRQRDTEIKAMLAQTDIDNRSFNASLLWEPWEVKKADGSPYRVFTPYYQKGCLALDPPGEPEAPPARLDCYTDELEHSLRLEQLDLLPRPDWQKAMMSHWTVGESAARDRLETFCEESLDGYREGRDFPARRAVSRLSPHLHYGEISPRQAWHQAEHAAMHGHADGSAHFLRELAWREFSYYLLYHFEDLPRKNFNPKFDGFPWRKDEARLQAWRQGKTGFPIVDAGMRELWQTGYMHNRVRMIVASFLVKNMLLDWRIGAAWFWDCLVDADLASNSASWQWCAGSGADAAPYFRIFNPVLQSEKFDAEGDYLLRFCPELEGLPRRYLHKPWEAPADVLQAAGIKLGSDYPQPILELKATRERALETFKSLP